MKRTCTQVPFESLKRAAKEKKASLDEVSSIAKMLDVQTAGAMTTAEQLDVLSKMAVRLQNLKRKVAAIFLQTPVSLLTPLDPLLHVAAERKQSGRTF